MSEEQNIEVSALTSLAEIDAGEWDACACPEAADGGSIALVQNGDIIDIDIPNRRLDIRVSESELEERKSKWKPKPAGMQGGSCPASLELHEVSK